MRIHWICGARTLGGAEMVTLTVIEGLRRKGHEAAVLCSLGGAVAAEAMRRGFARRELPLGGRTPRAWHALRTSLRDDTPDVALVTTSPEMLTTMLIPRPAATRLVLGRHMTIPLSRWLGRLVVRRADAMIAVSDAVYRSLAHGIPTSLLHVIHNPVRFTVRNTPPTTAERAAARQVLGLTGGGHWVGFFGGVHESKGARDVLDTVAAANHAGETTHLLLCGRIDPRMPPLATLVDERGLGGKVHYLGQIDRMHEAHTAVDVVVMATHTHLGEALPATIAEAMACGTPVLAYATGGMRELIGHDDEAGRLARPDDAKHLAHVLVEMLRDEPGRARLASQALERIRTLGDPERAVDLYEQLFMALTIKTRDG